MQPHVVSKVIKGDGEEIEFEPQPMNNGELVIQPETAEIVAQIMHSTYLNDIRDYETWYHPLENYNIGLKSGTALIANEFGYTQDVNTTNIGFDLSPERKFIMLVHVEKPEDRQLSFYNSRVMWLETFSAIKDHLQIPTK
jgi:cell division protein FtsI/penicillin-binding protein 2